MVIDSHVHIGKIDKFNMPESMVIESMKKYNIDFSLVSNIEGIEVDCEQNIIDREYGFPCEELITLVRLMLSLFMLLM